MRHMLQSGNVIFRARNNASPCLTSYVENIKAMSPSTASESNRRVQFTLGRPLAKRDFLIGLDVIREVFIELPHL